MLKMLKAYKAKTYVISDSVFRRRHRFVFYNFMISRMYIFILILSYETIWILSHDDVKFKKKCIRFLILNNFLLKLS